MTAPSLSARWLCGGLIAVTGSGLILALATLRWPTRGLLLLVAIAPAAAAARLLRGLDPVARLVAAATAAVVLNAIVAEFMLASGLWSPRFGLAAVWLISVAAALAAGRRPAPGSRSRWPAAGRRRTASGTSNKGQNEGAGC